MVCISRLNHPVARKTPTLKQFVQVGHVVVSPQGAPFLEQAQNTLKKAGLEPHIVLELPHVLAVGPVVARSDLFATLPEKLARRIAGPMRLKVFESPLAFPDFKISAIWHDRVHLDSGYSWFREFLSEVCVAL
jgi:DNA-binding transcriptional LysR family regulator